MDTNDIVQLAKDAGVQLVRFIYCDNSGVIRAKATHVDHLRGRRSPASCSSRPGR